MDGLETYLNEIRKLLKQVKTKDAAAAKTTRARETDLKSQGRRQSMGKIVKTELNKVDGDAGVSTPMSNGLTEIEEDDGLGGCKLSLDFWMLLTFCRWVLRCWYVAASSQEERRADSSGTGEEACCWEEAGIVRILGLKKYQRSQKIQKTPLRLTH